MSWLEKQVSIYECHADNTGKPVTFRQILINQVPVASAHRWYYADGKKGDPNFKWVNGTSYDIETICAIRNLDPALESFTAERVHLKQTLQAYTPAALLDRKKKGEVRINEMSGIMQLDFDGKDIASYDIDELKACLFDLPFIGYCGKSCGGDGLFALSLIEEPEKLSAYAEHAFYCLERMDIKVDTSKGPKPENLRYISYDTNPLWREDPKPLKLNTFKKRKTEKKTPQQTTPGQSTSKYSHTEKKVAFLVNSQLKNIRDAQKGQRWATVQKAAYTLGGLKDCTLLDAVISAIRSNSAFSGEYGKYEECAEVCFADGGRVPVDLDKWLEN